MIVHDSLFVFVLRPVFVARNELLCRRVMQAWVTVVIVAHVGFVVYPTVARRDRPGCSPGDSLPGTFGLVVACFWVLYETRMVVL
jgi:hypothetical protein